MRQELLIGLSSIVGLGVAAQLIAWRLHLPSIVLLLVFGFIAGPITGLLNPDALLGDLLAPLVSFAVAIILFEGGLTLRFRELPDVRRTVFRLISVGLLVTWVLATVLGYYVLQLNFEMALLLGAILTVSGPTVIIPLLRYVRPKNPLGPILRWEGILIDPVGAVIAVLVFEAVAAGRLNEAPLLVAKGVIATTLVGGSLGILGGLVLILLTSKYRIPDLLQNPVTLAVLLVTYSTSEYLHRESGLLCVTLMGFILGNWGGAVLRYIAPFKESLQVLLIASLFILLSARLDPDLIQFFDWREFLFLALLIGVVRPLAVLASTYKSDISWQGKVFLAFVCPRGIVAAAVSSLFALELTAAGYPDARLLVAYTFLVIVGAGFFYGFFSLVLADWLEVRQSNPQGILFIGANNFSRELARALHALGVRVLLADTNWRNVSQARFDGLEAHYGGVLSERSVDRLNLEGIGKLFAVTPNDEANSLSGLQFVELLGRREVYQLPLLDESEHGEEKEESHLRGRFLFGPKMDYFTLTRLLQESAQIKTTPLSADFSFEDAKQMYSELFVPLMLVDEAGKVEVYTKDKTPKPRPGQKLVALTKS